MLRWFESQIVVGMIEILSNKLLKPLLNALFNGLLQPIFVCSLEVAKAFKVGTAKHLLT